MKISKFVRIYIIKLPENCALFGVNCTANIVKTIKTIFVALQIELIVNVVILLVRFCCVLIRRRVLLRC